MNALQMHEIILNRSVSTCKIFKSLSFCFLLRLLVLLKVCHLEDFHVFANYSLPDPRSQKRSLLPPCQVHCILSTAGPKWKQVYKLLEKLKRPRTRENGEQKGTKQSSKKIEV